MTRVDELVKKYPSLPREFIAKWDVLRSGIRDSDSLEKVSRWTRARGGYQSMDHDVSLKELAATRPGVVRPGYHKTAGSFHLRNGLGCRIERDSASNYEIREREPGRFALFEGETKVEDVFFPDRQWPFDCEEEPVTSKGTPVTSLVPQTTSPQCFLLSPVRHCEYFSLGEQCKFCNYNQTQEDSRSIGMDHKVAVSAEETGEAFHILGECTRLVEGRIVSGAFKQDEVHIKAHLPFVERIASATSYPVNVGLSTQPVSRKNLQRLKDAGLSTVNFNMEVWDAELFAEVCPGKAKYRGAERFKEAFKEAVDVMGVGWVGCNFVGGVTLMPPNGHRTWRESRDSLVDGLRWLIGVGVVPSFCALRLGAGSTYGDDRSNRTRLVPTEFYLDAALAHHKAMIEHGLYSRMNKLLLCALDCSDLLYSGDLGFLELAGDPGRWMADAIPDEANWLARFVSWVRKGE